MVENVGTGTLTPFGRENVISIFLERKCKAYGIAFERKWGTKEYYEDRFPKIARSLSLFNRE